MTTLLTKLAWFSVRRRRLVLAVSAVFVVVAAGLGAGAFDALKGGGFDDRGSESSRAANALEEDFGTGERNLVLLVSSPTGSIDDPATTQAGLAVTERLARIPDVADVASYWTLDRAPALRNESGDEALVLGRITTEDDE